MGHIICGLHPRQRCCWRCDRCPKCDGIGPLLRGDYCRECTAAIRAQGLVWNPRYQDYAEESTLFSIGAGTLVLAGQTVNTPAPAGARTDTFPLFPWGAGHDEPAEEGN